MTRKSKTAATRLPALPEFTILDVMTDEALLGRHFDGPSWAVWKVFIAAMFGLPMTAADRAIYAKFTQREYRNAKAAEVNHAVLVCGRRSGKSRILALIGVYLALFRDWSKCLASGEAGTVLILAASKDQAKVIFRYVSGMLRETPMFERFIKRSTADTVVLTNGIEIKVTAASFRTTRGMTTIAVLMDEVAFWWSDEHAAESDVEIFRALKPGTMTVPGAKTMIASSPYRRTGLLWNEHRRLFGNDVKAELCWQAETREMNATVPQAEIDAELAKDYEAAKSEYLAHFRDDLEAFLSRDALEPVILQGVREIAPVPGVVYIGGFDGSGGTKGGDSATAAVAHFDRKAGYAVLDACREIKPPFSPEAVVAEFAKFFKSYHVNQIIGDRWGSGFVSEAWQRHGLTLKPAELTKSDFYLELLPAINSCACRILDNERLILQLTSLERRTSRSGKDAIDHPKGKFHDDLANAVAIALVSAKARPAMKIHADVLAAALRGPSQNWRSPGRQFEWPGLDPNAQFPSRIVS